MQLEEAQEEEVQESIVNKAPTIAVDMGDIVIEKKEEFQVESLKLKIVEVEHIDFIGVDNFNIHPNYLLANFFNKLRNIELSHGVKLDEFRVIRSFKHRKYSKYLFYWHGRFQASKWHSKASFVKKMVFGV